MQKLTPIQRAEKALLHISDPRYREFTRQAIEKAHKGDWHDFNLATNYRRFPVEIEEFVCSKAFLNKKDEIYPKILDELIECNSGEYVEAVFTGAIGAGKTTAALYTVAYQLYLLSCLQKPHQMFELDPASEILFIFQSINARLAQSVDYTRFKTMIEHCEYFRKEFPFNPHRKSRLFFPNRIEVAPISGSDTGAIGQNVIGGLIDELNFMSVVEKSNKSVDRGVYDQAIAVYNSIARRRKSRFMKQGKLPGILCLVSSKRYPGQFTDQKEDEAKEEIRRTGKTTIYVYDKRHWEVAPEGRYTGRKFSVFIGDLSRKPRIMEPGETVDAQDQSLVDQIPEEYRTEFERDIMNALRDIAGRSTLAMYPFFQNREDIADAFGQHVSILSAEETDFTSPPLQIFPKRFFRPDLPRYIHIDLSLRKDSTGVTCGCVPGFAAIARGDDEYESMPQVRLDFQLRVKPPRGGEILYYKIRSLIYALREKGLNIKWISCDSFQSTDMLQLLRQQGFTCGELSMDKTTLPYEVLKTAVYDHRVTAPDHPHCEKELVALEVEPKKQMVDHPPNGSKDVADSMAGVVFGLTMRREIWNMFDVPVIKMPGSLQEVFERERERMRDEGNYVGMLNQQG